MRADSPTPQSRDTGSHRDCSSFVGPLQFFLPLPSAFKASHRYLIELRFVPGPSLPRGLVEHSKEVEIAGLDIAGVEAVDDLAHQLAHLIGFYMRHLGPGNAPAVRVDHHDIGKNPRYA